jgi:ribosomal protein L37AE/L43A
MLKTLMEILALPEVLETHACEECGHPQRRRLPDGVFHCPACHAEVAPLELRVSDGD